MTSSSDAKASKRCFWRDRAVSKSLLVTCIVVPGRTSTSAPFDTNNPSAAEIAAWASFTATFNWLALLRGEMFQNEHKSPNVNSSLRRYLPNALEVNKRSSSFEEDLVREAAR